MICTRPRADDDALHFDGTCGLPATVQIGDRWYCAACADVVLAWLDRAAGEGGSVA